MIASSSPERNPWRSFQETGTDNTLEGNHLSRVRLDGSLHREQSRHRVAPDVSVEQAYTRPRRASETARFTLTEDLPTPPLPEATASTLAVAGIVSRAALSWALSRALAMERRPLGGVHHPRADIY